MRILVVEDEAALRKELVDYLQRHSFSVETAENGIDGLYYATDYNIDLAIVDLGLPKMDGITLIKAMRRANLTFPILVLTARDSWQEKVETLDCGADDYLIKPCNLSELLARINALIRRAGGWSSTILQADPLKLDLHTHVLTVDDRPVTLTNYEFKLIKYFLLNPGKLLSKAQLTEVLYGADGEYDSNVIEVFIRRLRAKIDPKNSIKPLETLRGQGYKFVLKPEHKKAHST